MIKHIFGWDNVIVINGDDSYSANGAAAFKNAAGGKDLNVLQSLWLPIYVGMENGWCQLLSIAVNSI